MTSSLTLADAAWLHMERPENLMMICGLLTLDRTPDRERLLALLKHRLCSHLRFRSRVVESPLALPQWSEVAGFDPQGHLLFEDLDGGPQSLMERVGQLMSQPLDRARPLWEFRVFPQAHTGVAGESAAMLVRLHHAIGDGISLMRVMLELADRNPDAPWPMPQEPAARATLPLWERARRLTENWLHRGHDVLFHPAQSYEVSKSLAKVLALPPDAPHSLKGPLGTAKRASASLPLDLDEVKQLGRRLGSTVNDVLMAALAGALGRTLKRRESVPEEMALRAVVPVDLRGGDSRELNNRFGLVFLTLPVGCSQAAERLRRTRENMHQLKNSPEALVTYELLSAVGATPREWEAAIINWFGDKASAVVTNLPGPRQPLYLGQARIESVMYWVPQSGNLGLGVSFLSYAGRIRLGVTSDAGLFPDPEELQRDFLESYQELESL